MVPDAQSLLLAAEAQMLVDDYAKRLSGWRAVAVIT